MKNRNELIRLIREIIGEEKEDGFYTPVQYNDNVVNVPNFLFKDGASEDPEIRISPFLSDTRKTHPIRVTTYGKHVKRRFYSAIFQIDIYATNIILANNIYSAIKRRIDFFYDIDTVLYGYDKDFQLIDEERSIYYHKGYNTDNFKIISIYFGNIPLRRVYNKKDLQKRDTYYINDTGLYVNTLFNIKMIKINNIVSGLTFSDGQTANSKGIVKTRTLNKRQISELEKNNVERISFELGIDYILDQERNPGPIATDIIVDSD